jgi:hypothetical protein
MKTFQFGFGEKALEKAWLEVKTTIQAPHLHPTISKSIVRQADAWASSKWGMAFNYQDILRKLGVTINED